ncbi:ParA family protein [Bacillus alkalicellulosilyticus]|uniref:ParA family protein n=1 Tax=Alkalihalobacterium alkalicellulosilyticum TaxID=1912214 RepID=UPI000995FBD2|nr:AAA family ATPase [Bacillus alkalicellulosilyticus]
MAKKIFVGNYKGGVGKTTTIYQLALHMAEENKKVLLIDLDPQCSLSEICLAKMERLLSDLSPPESLNYIYDIWSQTKHFPTVRLTFDTTLLIKRLTTHIDFIPSNIHYRNGGLDQLAMNLNSDLDDLIILQQFFESTQIDEEYDYILFDCPPSNTIITQGAFLLSDYFIIPTVIQTMSVRGVAHYISTVETIYQKYCMDHSQAMLAQALFGPEPKLIGIIETMNRPIVNYEVEFELLRSALEEKKIKTLISEKSPGNHILSSKIRNLESIARDTAKGVKNPEFSLLTVEILSCLTETQQDRGVFHV